uniref:Uncharacterized protein n=1 Tax=Meloidogyne incognita TaxID=6306 RepID=A0A914MKU5_MELIC
MHFKNPLDDEIEQFHSLQRISTTITLNGLVVILLILFLFIKLEFALLMYAILNS